jgi:hypothetical protein
MSDPNRQRLETALQNAHNAGDTEAAKTLAQEIRRLDSGMGVTPAQPANPGARTGQVLNDAQRFIDTSQDVEARSLNRDIQGTGFEVARDPQTNDPFARKSGGDPFAATGPEMLNFDSPAMGAGTTLLQGYTLGAGGEIAGMVNPGAPQAKQFFDDTRNAFAAENPVTAMGVELAGAAPNLMLGAVSGAPRLAAAAEGAAYGFNEPQIGGESLVSRSGNATVGAALGRVLGGAGASTSNQVQRTRNRLSGAPTIQSVAQDDFGITLTEGQIKQDVGLQGFERDARKGAKGQDAADVAIQSFKDQEQATLNAGRGLGGDRFATSNQAADDFLSGVRGRVQTQQDDITQAYERARGFDAQLSAKGAQSMPDAVVSGLDGDLLQQLEIDPDGFKQLHPNTSAAMRSVANLGAVGQQRGGLPFEQLETTRRIINNAISASAQNPADRRAAMQLKGSFDKFIDSAVDQKLFSGDDAFIGAYQEARGLRAAFAEDWEANKVFKKLIESDATPEMAINFVLGGGRLAGDNQMQVLRQLKTALADDPETIAALQEAYIKKFMRQTEKTFNPKVLRDGLDELLIGKNQSFATELLDEEQYTQLRKFRSVVDSMVPMDGSVNTSNTGAMIERARGAASDLLTGPMRSGPVRVAGRAIGEALGKVGVRTSGARARQQFNPARGMDTRRIEGGFPEANFTPRADQLPQGPPQNAFNQTPPASGGAPAQVTNAFADDPVTNGIPTLANSTVQGGVIGAGAGAMAPADSNEERLRNMAIGGAMGAGAGKIDAGRRALPIMQNGPGGGLQRGQTSSAIRDGLREAGGRSRAPVSIETGRPVEPLPDNLRKVVDASTPIPGVKPSSRTDVSPSQARGQLRDDLLRQGDDPQQVDQLIELLGDDAVNVLRDSQLGPAVSRGYQSGTSEGGGLALLVGGLGVAGAYAAIKMAMRDSGNTKATPEDVSRAIEKTAPVQGLPTPPSAKPPLNAFAL